MGRDLGLDAQLATQAEAAVPEPGVPGPAGVCARRCPPPPPPARGLGGGRQLCTASLLAPTLQMREQIQGRAGTNRSSKAKVKGQKAASALQDGGSSRGGLQP